MVVSPGASNCSWTSCREGCTKELYDCTQIRVNYKLPVNTTDEIDQDSDGEGRLVQGVEDDENRIRPRYERALKDYNYIEDLEEDEFAEDDDLGLPKPFPTGTIATGEYHSTFISLPTPKRNAAQDISSVIHQ